MYKRTNILIECELSLYLDEYETIDGKLKDLGITKYKILKIEDKGGHLIYKWIVFCKLIMIWGHSKHIFFCRRIVINDAF